jgi:hypothetical protein
MVLNGTYAEGVIEVIGKDLFNDYSGYKFESEIR